ncbi:MAG: SGNH/GDSL hydrolase family protein [Planctomycetota bacterium]
MGDNKTTLRRRVSFRCFAVALSLVPFVAFEWGLRIAGVGEIRETEVPAIGFEATYPLFELDEAGEHFEIAKSRQAYFYPDSFAARKPPHEFRIFCLGGSTVQGRPYSIETSFTTWLELSLNAADPNREWQVVNCGGVSYASYRLVPILKEILAYEPDLFVIYTGHNEFLEARTFAGLPRVTALSHVRTLSLLRSACWGESRLQGPGQPRETLAAEVDTLLDYRGGLADYHRDDAGRRVTVEQFAENVRQMIDLARAANVPVVLMNPASNLKDTPPFKIEPRSDLTAKEAAEFATLFEQARQAEEADEKAELLEQAVAIDGRHAGARFLLGHASLAQHRPDEAREQFNLAKDEDVCPLRMIEPLHAALFALAESSATPLIDVCRDFGLRATDGIPGDNFFLDHVHPTINNHQVIARLLVDHLVAAGFCHPQADWEVIRDERYRHHLSTLDTPYYAKGKQRLAGLRRWAQGRSNKLRDGTSLPPALD